jgi:HEAT repeat protein
MAKHDADSEVRGQALFWLAQEAGDRAAEAIQDAIEDDPDTEVKEAAVFALTQMPSDEGIPELIRVAKTNRNPEVRKKAVFWLGQSRDPRAVDFIEDLLGH